MSDVDTLNQEYNYLMGQYDEIKQRIQSKCPHKEILHDAGFRSFGTYHAQRRCANCGYTETGSWWSYRVDDAQWSLKDFKEPAVLGPKNGRSIKEVSEKEFQSAYVPR